MKQKRILLVLLSFAAGCSIDAPSGAAVNVSSVPSSAATRAAVDNGRANPPPPTPSAPDAAESMCAAREPVLFSCRTSSGKHVSLCATASEDQGHVYYAYGSPGHPELVFPDERRPATGFKRTQLFFAGSTGGYAYSFVNDSYRYIIFSVSGAEGLEEQGVLVTRGNARKAVASLRCVDGSVVEVDAPGLLDLTLTWPVDPDLDRYGLPEGD